MKIIKHKIKTKLVCVYNKTRGFLTELPGLESYIIRGRICNSTTYNKNGLRYLKLSDKTNTTKGYLDKNKIPYEDSDFVSNYIRIDLSFFSYEKLDWKCPSFKE